jgi:hypothetical protein
MNKIYGAIAAGVIYAAGVAGCTNVSAKQDSKLEQMAVDSKQPTEAEVYTSKGNHEKVLYLKAQLTNVKKDGVVNPNEISTIETTVKRAEELANALKGDDAISKALQTEASAINADGKKTINDLYSSDQLKGYAIVVYQEQPGNSASSVRIFGVTEGDHMALEGKLAEQAAKLGFDANKAFAKRVTKDTWGYRRETKIDKPAIQRDLYDNVTWIETPEALTQYFVKNSIGGKELSNSTDSISEKRYNDGLAKGKILRVAVVYKMETREPTIKDDKSSAAPEKVDPKIAEGKTLLAEINAEDAKAKAAEAKAKADAEAKAKADAEAKAKAEAEVKAKKAKDRTDGFRDIDDEVEGDIRTFRKN